MAPLFDAAPETDASEVTDMASNYLESPSRLGACVAFAAAMLLASPSANADDPTGDASYSKIPASVFLAYSCEELWFMRNDIYNMRGYCFTTQKAIATFDNSDCVSSDPNILNSFEQHNVNVIKQVERQKGC